MTFEGCKSGICKCAAGGLVCLFVAAAPHDQFCEQQHRPTYCNLAWDLPHGPESDQGSINWVLSPATVVSSTSSSSNTLIFVNNSNGVINFVNGSGEVIVWQVGDVSSSSS
jgi:hypothetical protein